MARPKFNFLTLSILFFVLSACAALPTIDGGPPRKPQPPSTQGRAEIERLSAPMQCVPYAREVSGIAIRGDAYTWWGQAAGRYDRGRIPRPGAVMVLSKAGKLRHGHLAVVTRVISDREIEVTHSNWGDTRDRRCLVYKNMRVQDMSPYSDWTIARFWNYELGTWGLPYAVSGFIYP
jgi:surface antigen